MKIAVNTRLLLAGRLEGVGWFTYEILSRVVRAHPEHEFHFLFDRKPAMEFLFAPNVKPVILYPQARHPLLWYMFFQWSIPFYLKKEKIDIFISTDGWMPLGLKCPSLNVIHDLSFEHFPSFVKYSHQRYYKHYYPLFAKQADVLLTVSEYTRKDISELYGINQANINVVYNSAKDVYKPINTEAKNKIRAEYTQTEPYYIYMGSINRRKNVLRMLQGFDLFKQRTGLKHRFVIVGSPMWKDKEMEISYSKLKYKDSVLWLGRKEPEELNKLVASAEAMVYVSVFEGFGIPIVEAFAAQTAVITSNVSSMPEIGGDAAHYVDPYSVESISQGLEKIATDIDYKNSLIEKGNIRLQVFSWDRSAKLFYQAMESIM